MQSKAVCANMDWMVLSMMPELRLGMITETRLSIMLRSLATNFLQFESALRYYQLTVAHCADSIMSARVCQLDTVPLPRIELAIDAANPSVKQRTRAVTRA